MKKIVIAGGTGFLGSCLTKYYISKGYQVVILSRSHQLDKPNIHYVTWDAKSKGPWEVALEGAELLVNLTGKSVDCSYTAANKQLIYDSRINSTYILGEAIKELKTPPKLWINAASATIYRHALDREMDEETGELGANFSEDVCQKWEHTFNSIKLPNTRKVILRIGIVLGADGGALEPLMNLVKIGLGGKQGKGNQFVSWIHESDFVEAVDYVLKHETATGIYNVTSPTPVNNSHFMSALRKVRRIRLGVPMPTWLLQLGAVIIRTETELILKSRRVVPKRLMDLGFKFQFGNIDTAINHLVK